MKKRLPHVNPSIAVPFTQDRQMKGKSLFTKFYKLLSLILILSMSSAYAHITDIRVNQAQDGSLTWYLSTYHYVGQCGVANSGLTINGVNYPLEAEYAGDVNNLSSNVFAQVGGYAHNSYAVVHTPFLGTTLSVQPYSSNVCWAFLVGGNGSFNPPPPPVCTSAPVTGFTNTVAASGNNSGTFCDPTDDVTSSIIHVSHLACANITGDKQFRVVFDPSGSAVSYGPFYYNSGVSTDVTIAIPYGTSNTTMVQVIDDDYPAQITHSITIPNGQYLGEAETVPPTLSLSSAIVTGNSPGICGAVVIYPVPIGSDNCSAVSVTQIAGLPSGSIFPRGTTTNTFKATDASGNSVTASFTVTVNDTESPIPTNSVTGTSLVNIPDGSSSNWVPYTFNFADPLPTGSTIVGVDISYNGVDQGWGGTGDYNNLQLAGTYLGGNQFFHYAQNLSISYNGAVPNYNYGGTNAFQMFFTGYPGWVGYFRSGVITIRYKSEALPDVIGECTVSITEKPTASDNCSGLITATTSDPLTYSTQGNYLIHWTYTDGAGNVSTQSQKVIVKDITPPVAPVIAAVTGQCDATVTSVPSATDNCAGTITGTTSDPLSYSTQGTHVITWSFDDGNGNVSTATQNVIVKDDTAPIVLTQNRTIQLNSSGLATITAGEINNGSTDNCGIASIVLSKTAFDCSNFGANTVTLTVTDIHGNVSSKTATVTVEDNVAPIVLTQNLSIPLSGGTATITAAQVNNGSTDNCGIATMTIDKTSFDCSTIGNHTLTLTVTDIHGNVASKTATVTIVGELTSSSIASVPTSTIYTGGVSTNLYLGYGAQSTTLQVSNIVVGGNGTNPKSYTYVWSGSASSQLSSTTSGSPVFTPTSGGYYTFNVEVTNKYGCKSAASISICVKDIREVDKKGSYTGKVYICHAPPGNVGNTNTLSISVNAVASHLSQHSYDRLGSCADAPCTAPSGVLANLGTGTIDRDVIRLEVKESGPSKLIAYPNPFAQQTTVSFSVPYLAEKAVLDIYDVRGVKIQNLYNNSANADQTYEVQFNGQNMAAGTYFFRLSTSKEVKNFKVIMTN